MTEVLKKLGYRLGRIDHNLFDRKCGKCHKLFGNGEDFGIGEKEGKSVTVCLGCLGLVPSGMV